MKMSAEGDAVKVSKQLVELRVVDLKAELEKRGLEKTGVKAALIERLKKAIEDEGKNPDEHMFEVSEATPMKKGSTNTKMASRLRGKGKGDGDGTDEEEMEDEELDMENMTEVDEVKGEEDDTKILEENDINTDDAIQISLEDEEKLLDEDIPNTDKQKSENKEAVPTPEKKQDNPATGTKASGGTSPKNGSTEGKVVSSRIDSMPPTPTSVPASVAFTKEDTIRLDTSSERKDDDLSLIVHVDDTQNDLDNDILDKKEGSSDRENTESSVKEQKKKSEDTTSEKTEKATESPSNDTAPATGNSKKADGGTKDEGHSKSHPSGETKSDQKKSEGWKKEAEKGKSSPTKDPKSADKARATSKPSSSNRNLWVSGLSSSTRATDLKTLFSKYGKVAGAKVVTNARSPGSRCYGFVTMSTADEASKCIQHLHRTELHGRMISVERAKGDPAAQAKSAAKAKSTKPAATPSKDQKKDEKSLDKKEEKKDGEKKVAKDDKSSSGNRRHSSGDRRHGPASRSRRHSSDHTRPGTSRDSHRSSRTLHSRTRSSPGGKPQGKDSPKKNKPETKTDTKKKKVPTATLR